MSDVSQALIFLVTYFPPDELYKKKYIFFIAFMSGEKPNLNLSSRLFYTISFS